MTTATPRLPPGMHPSHSVRSSGTLKANWVCQWCGATDEPASQTLGQLMFACRRTPSSLGDASPEAIAKASLKWPSEPSPAPALVGDFPADMGVPAAHDFKAAAVANAVRSAEMGHLDEHDAVTLPNHYARFKIEPIRFIMENRLPFEIGNVIKYCLRWDAKDGIQDLYKAQRYLEMTIKLVEGDPDWWRKPKGDPPPSPLDAAMRRTGSDG